MGDYLKLMIPSAFMMQFEWTGYEFVLLLAGYISVAAAGACSIIMNMYCVVMMIVFGGLVSSSCLVGKSLG